MMREREDVVGLEASIIMHRAVWKASGHEDTFCRPDEHLQALQEAHPVGSMVDVDG